MRRRRRQSYSDLVLSMAPLVYWRLGERSGTVGRDSFRAVHGTYVGTPTLGTTRLIPGDGNTGMTLSGAATQYMSFPYPGITTGKFTVVALYRRNGAPAGPGANEYHTIIGGFMGEAVAMNMPRVLLRESDGQILFQWLDSGGATRTLTVTGVAGRLTGTHMYGASHDGTTGRAWCDGVEVGTPTAFSLRSGSTGGGRVGLHGVSTDYPVNGTLQEPAIWDRVLTSAEHRALYETSLGR
jgi:hypothetical protein